MTTTQPKRILVPYLLSFDSSTNQLPRRVQPGRGEAGWSVFEFTTLDEAHAWAARNQASRMPCWKRRECWGGEELGMRRTSDTEIPPTAPPCETAEALEEAERLRVFFNSGSKTAGAALSFALRGDVS